MKKLFLFITLILVGFLAKSQIANPTGFYINALEGLTLKGDTIGYFFTIVPDDTIVSKSYVDSLTATLEGGHAPVTLHVSAVNGGLAISGQQLSFTKASPSTSGYISATDFQNFTNKLSFVYHDETLTGNGTAASPLSADTTRIALREWVYTQLDSMIYIDWDSIQNKPDIPIISNTPYGSSWDGNLDGATKNVIYQKIQSLAGADPDLNYAAHEDYGQVYSTTGDTATIPAGSLSYSSLMLPEDLATLYALKQGYGVDSIYSEIDIDYPIESLYYDINDSTYKITEIAKPDGLIFGGNVTWVSGLTFNVSHSAYYIGGQFLTSDAGSVTLDNAHATLNRIDVIALNDNSQIVVIKGIAAESPQKPTINPQSEIELTQVLLLAGQTEPSDPNDPGSGTITNLKIYDENIEWTGSSNANTYSFSDVTNPYVGSIATNITGIDNTEYVSYSTNTAISIFDYESINLYMYLKSALGRKDGIGIQFYNNNNPVSDLVSVFPVRTLIETYQLSAISISSMNVTSDFIDEVRIIFNTTPPYSTYAGFYIDNIYLQTGIVQPPTTTYQILSTNGSAGNISISGGNTITLNVNDADNDPTNEIQTIDTFQIVDNILSISLSDDNEAPKTVGLSSYLDNTDDQTASEVSYTNTISNLTATDVQAAIDEIDATVDNIILTGGDNWGNDVVNTDLTLNGDGTIGNILKVDTSVIATVNNVNNLISDSLTIFEGSLEGDNWGTDVVNSDITLTGDGTSGNLLKVDTTLIPTYTQMREEISDSIAGLSSGGDGITALTGEVTASGTGSVVATVADNVIDYGNVDETLKSSTTNNSLTWDISANGIIFCTPSSGTVSFSNYQVNKSITVVLTLSGATISWPASAKILEGSATLEDGTFYVYIHCISSSIFTVSITKEAS